MGRLEVGHLGFGGAGLSFGDIVRGGYEHGRHVHKLQDIHAKAYARSRGLWDGRFGWWCIDVTNMNVIVVAEGRWSVVFLALQEGYPQHRLPIQRPWSNQQQMRHPRPKIGTMKAFQRCSHHGKERRDLTQMQKEHAQQWGTLGVGTNTQEVHCKEKGINVRYKYGESKYKYKNVQSLLTY